MTTLALPSAPSLRRLSEQARRLAPGVALCLAVTLAAMGVQALEERLFGRAWIEGLVLAILIGTAVRTAWKPGAAWSAGVGFSAKTLLEIAVALLGAGLSAAALLAAGPGLLAGIAAVVVIALVGGYGLGRTLGLPRRTAALVATGNAICGNSAIAAVAPVIKAEPEEVGSAIAFTAVLGVIVVLALPLLVPALHLSQLQYGTIAGLTVYAVPQVLAATAPVGPLALQVGTLVKLARVLMLGPVVVGFSLLQNRRAAAAGETLARPPLHKLVPWFVVAFLLLAVLNSLGAIPHALATPMASTAKLLTVVSMAALGLGVDVRTVAKAGPRVAAAATGSVIGLALAGLVLVKLLHLA
ncbi:YeiH family protein [Caulobacter sp. 17J80-11]|uniref:YeiH family protein n=1 Tax=Caulobacter sp. 17J80-11 TaxID=2763502 RepID=UPI001653DDB5|nr:putative sulfate exporter family transporter [Caulobacter sp. 17J80-11]MBC6980970.1 putative sulfate exporter family transporter [Caulobacter sp. 17J80-11]